MKEKEPSLAKCMPPLGPFPRYIWIHHATPPDKLDSACYDIWQRTQRLPDGLKPKYTPLFPENPKKVEAEHRVEPVNEKDELTRLVEQEYMNLIMENLFDCFSVESTNKNNGIDKETSERRSQALKIERLIKSLLFKKHSPEKIKPTNAKISLFSDRCIVKNMSTKQDICKNERSETAGQMLQMQNLVKADECAVTTKTVMASNSKTGTINLTLNSVISRTENQPKENEQQLPVFAKFCSKVQDSKARKQSQGFKRRSRSGTFPGMTYSWQPDLMFIPIPLPVIVGAINHSCFISFAHPVHIQIFPGQYQADLLQISPIPFVQFLQTQIGCYTRQL